MAVDHRARVKRIPVGAPCVVNGMPGKAQALTMGNHLGGSAHCQVQDASGATLLVLKRNVWPA